MGKKQRGVFKHLNQSGSAALGVREGKSGEKLVHDISILVRDPCSSSPNFDMPSGSLLQL